MNQAQMGAPSVYPYNRPRWCFVCRFFWQTVQREAGGETTTMVRRSNLRCPRNSKRF